MVDFRDIDIAVDQFTNNPEFVRLYNRHNRELLLQHFLLIAAAGDDVWRANQERKMTMPEQRDQMLIKYIEWLDKMSIEFPDVEKPFDVSDDWWRLMLLAYERKPISGKSLWRKFKEDTRNPILSSFNNHWVEPREGETMEERFRIVRRGVWRDLGHRDDEFLPEGSWLPKQWYAWRYCCYPGKNFRAFDGKLPTAGMNNALGRRQLLQMNGGDMSGIHNHSGSSSLVGASGPSWAAAIPIDAGLPVMDGGDLTGPSSVSMQDSQGAQQATSSIQHLQLQQQQQQQQHQHGTMNSGMRPGGGRSSMLSASNGSHRLVTAGAGAGNFMSGRMRGVGVGAGVGAAAEEELAVQQYLADVQQYMVQMTRLEKAVALAEGYGEHDKAAGYKRQLYEHVQTDPPAPLKRVAFAGNAVRGDGNPRFYSQQHSTVGDGVAVNPLVGVSSSGGSVSSASGSGGDGGGGSGSSGNSNSSGVMQSASLPVSGSPGGDNSISTVPSSLPLTAFASSSSHSMHSGNGAGSSSNNNGNGSAMMGDADDVIMMRLGGNSSSNNNM